jgi:hypothetical protein
MNIAAALGILALLPAAANVATSAPHEIVLTICSGDADPRIVVVPLTPGAPEGGGNPDCAKKGCHAANSRRRSGCQFDTPQ